MPFGKKLTEKLGEDKVIDVSLSNIKAAVETFLRQMKAIKDSDDVFALNLDNITGKNDPDIIRIVVKIRK